MIHHIYFLDDLHFKGKKLQLQLSGSIWDIKDFYAHVLHTDNLEKN